MQMLKRDNSTCNQKQTIKLHKYLYNKQIILGKGALSVVYKGIDESTKEIIAIKKIKKKSLTTEYMIDSLLNEIKLHREIQCENIVRMKDSFQTNDHIYIILEYCNSGSLRALMNNQKRFQEKDAIKIISQIILGLDALNSQNIIHRDLKPENILCHKQDGSLILKICDLGYSKMISTKDEMLQSSIGSLQYMDLHRLLGDRYSFKSDIFSLGIIFYELLFGEVPWKGSNLEEYRLLLITKPLIIPDQNISEATISFLKKALAISEDERMSWEEVKRHEIFHLRE